MPFQGPLSVKSLRLNIIAASPSSNMNFNAASTKVTRVSKVSFVALRLTGLTFFSGSVHFPSPNSEFMRLNNTSIHSILASIRISKSFSLSKPTLSGASLLMREFITANLLARFSSISLSFGPKVGCIFSICSAHTSSTLPRISPCTAVRHRSISTSMRSCHSSRLVKRVLNSSTTFTRCRCRLPLRGLQSSHLVFASLLENFVK